MLVFRGVNFRFLFKMTQIWYIPPINLEVFSYPHFHKTPGFFGRPAWGSDAIGRAQNIIGNNDTDHLHSTKMPSYPSWEFVVLSGSDGIHWWQFLCEWNMSNQLGWCQEGGKDYWIVTKKFSNMFLFVGSGYQNQLRYEARICTDALHTPHINLLLMCSVEQFCSLPIANEKRQHYKQHYHLDGHTNTLWLMEIKSYNSVNDSFYFAGSYCYIRYICQWLTLHTNVMIQASPRDRIHPRLPIDEDKPRFHLEVFRENVTIEDLHGHHIDLYCTLTWNQEMVDRRLCYPRKLVFQLPCFFCVKTFSQRAPWTNQTCLDHVYIYNVNRKREREIQYGLIDRWKNQREQIDTVRKKKIHTHK